MVVCRQGGLKLVASRIPIVAVDLSPLSALAEMTGATQLNPLVNLDRTTFGLDDLVREVQREITRYKEGGFMITCDAGYMHGVIARVIFLQQSRFQVGLVDHNEPAQASKRRM